VPQGNTLLLRSLDLNSGALQTPEWPAPFSTNADFSLAISSRSWPRLGAPFELVLPGVQQLSL